MPGHKTKKAFFSRIYLLYYSVKCYYILVLSILPCVTTVVQLRVSLVICYQPVLAILHISCVYMHCHISHPQKIKFPPAPAGGFCDSAQNLRPLFVPFSKITLSR